jgi:hypothetical protein
VGGRSNNLGYGFSQSRWILGPVNVRVATFENLHDAIHNLQAQTDKVSVWRNKWRPSEYRRSKNTGSLSPRIISSRA